MAKKYDVIVVGAGPAGFLAAKAAGENGLEVALVERKPDVTALTRACGQTLVSMNEYYFGNLCNYNACLLDVLSCPVLLLFNLKGGFVTNNVLKYINAVC